MPTGDFLFTSTDLSIRNEWYVPTTGTTIHIDPNVNMTTPYIASPYVSPEYHRKDPVWEWVGDWWKNWEKTQSEKEAEKIKAENADLEKENGLLRKTVQKLLEINYGEKE